MRVEMATFPGSAEVPNQDHVSAALPASGTGGALVVLDGVTPPAGDDGCRHGVPWYTARLGAGLLQLSGSRRDMTLAQCLARAVVHTSDGHRSTCDLSHPRTPQATVVLVRWDDEAVEHLVLSDSVLLLASPTGAVTPVLDQRLDPVRAAASTLPRAERAARVEARRNVAGGFFTAAADPSVAERAVTGTTPRERVRSLAALTDGATRWTETFGLGDWAALHTALCEQGPTAVLRRVRAAEAADPEGVDHPRGKACDDATAALVVL
ncbi:protein phosphatase 2C domain-containing protein [Streptomyces chumphonensis]|uniref:Protein phosphatase 2C-like protein n=1 Tax=Streptomyces chumphonensis TaxID=1214925 RepID=A0A927F151_9ACTN|nr:hypothetical protein [Streptomyces chumphonensis]MBD3933684.1 hypothetical protein [Streptomyces chumphonensis]